MRGGMVVADRAQTRGLPACGREEPDADDQRDPRNRRRRSARSSTRPRNGMSVM
jgi:hypothetical protein